MQFLDAEARRQLGFDQVWSRLKPVSPQGRARQHKAAAFEAKDRERLEEELDRVERICRALQTNPKVADNLLYFLTMVRDINGTLNRSMQGSTLDDMEFYEIKKLLLIAKEIQTELERLEWTSLLAPLDLCPECREALSVGQRSKESFYIADAYDPKLAKVRRERIRLEGLLADFRGSVESKIMHAAGRTLSMDGDITVSKAEPELISRLEAIENLAPVHLSAHSVTFALVENESMHQTRQELGQSREEEEACKQEIRGRLTQTVATSAPRLLGVLEQLAYLDIVLAKGRLSAEIDGVKPRLFHNSNIRIEEGRHLLVEEEVQQRGHTYTPLNVEVSAGVTIVTGPNMGGKTASLKMIGLLTAMAQYGLLVPAAAMEFSPQNFIRAHLTAAEIPKGLSAFAGELAFLRDVIQNSQGGGLILVDEIAHGTNPPEGAAMAQAIIEELCQKISITVITTHYPSLARLGGVLHLRVRGLERDRLGQGQMAALQNHMDYRLEKASPDGPFRSNAALVAEAVGLDPRIIARAKELQEKGDRSHG